jgi:hypothetical protein
VPIRRFPHHIARPPSFYGENTASVSSASSFSYSTEIRGYLPRSEWEVGGTTVYCCIDALGTLIAHNGAQVTGDPIDRDGQHS